MTEPTLRNRLAALLHELGIGCLENYLGEPVASGDDHRTHLRDADRLLAAGVTVGLDVPALLAENERLRGVVDEAGFVAQWHNAMASGPLSELNAELGSLGEHARAALADPEPEP